MKFSWHGKMLRLSTGRLCKPLPRRIAKQLTESAGSKQRRPSIQAINSQDYWRLQSLQNGHRTFIRLKYFAAILRYIQKMRGGNYMAGINQLSMASPAPCSGNPLSHRLPAAHSLPKRRLSQ
jgi:hypothetical protein